MSMVDVVRQLMGMPPNRDSPLSEMSMFVTAPFRDPNSPGISYVLFRFEGQRMARRECMEAGRRVRQYCEARWESCGESWYDCEECTFTACIRVVDDYRLACYEAWLP